ncbi:MAG TPA: hypothetical protein VK050_02870 [Flavobacteriaceae bacterium]|nr:hypothetical protein [Flavobacteriaceae bacterium]
MDNGSFIVGIVILLAFIIPIGWVIFKSNNKIQKRKKLVQNLCKDHGMLVDKPEQVGNALIGIDYKNKKMFYTSLKNITTDFIMIPTDSITDIRVNKEKYAGRESILLVIIEITTTKDKQRLILYDDKLEDQVVIDAKACLHEANQWVAQVNPQFLGKTQMA